MRNLAAGLLLLLDVSLCTAQFSLAQTSDELLCKGSALVQASRSFEAEQVLKIIRRGDASFPAAATVLGFLFLRRSALAEAEDTLAAKIVRDLSANLKLGAPRMVDAYGRKP